MLIPYLTIIIVYIYVCMYLMSIGFFLNYFRLLNLANSYDVKCVHMILICSSFATTIAIFLHTLRFKGYLDPKISLFAYVISYLSTFIGYAYIVHVFIAHPYITVICAIGLCINLYSYMAFDIYQCILCVLFVHRDKMIFLLS